MFSVTRNFLVSLGLCVLIGCSGGDSGPTSPASPPPGPAPVLATISPTTMSEGASVTITGSHFSPSPSANLVTIDGIEARVTSATASQLSVVVPVFDCRPQRSAAVRVRVSGKQSNAVDAIVGPAQFMNAAIGEMVFIDDPAELCLQFPPSVSAMGEYLVGVGSAAERPDELLTLSLSGVTGQPAAVGGSVVPARPLDTSRLPGASSGHGNASDRWARHVEAELQIRRLERTLLSRSRLEGISPIPRDAGQVSFGERRTVPAVGDQVMVNLPRWDATSIAEACTPVPITTVVRVVGQRAVFLADVENPASAALTDADIQGFSDAFDAWIYDTHTQYFGAPSDLDQNQRIVVVLTVEINKAFGGNLGAGVSVVDLLDPSECPASNLGEMYYSGVPDPGNEAGTIPRDKKDVTDFFLQVIAHELTHITQNSTRLSLGATEPLSAWELEGQAVVAREVVGHAGLGLQPGQDYGAATALSQTGTPWYEGLMISLATYYGYDPAGPKRSDTPETCTLLFTSVLAPTGCDPSSGYGAAWSFVRYVADRYGPDWPGGEAGLMRDWISANPNETGTDNVAALLGRPFGAVFAEWAATHYLDGRVSNPALNMTSWDLPEILTSLGGDTSLLPAPRSFSAFQETISIRGGSTAYSLFSDAGPRPATAIRVRSSGGEVLGVDMRPQIWVVRTR